MKQYDHCKGDPVLEGDPEDPDGWKQCESINGEPYYIDPVNMQMIWQWRILFSKRKTTRK